MAALFHGMVDFFWDVVREDRSDEAEEEGEGEAGSLDLAAPAQNSARQLTTLQRFPTTFPTGRSESVIHRRHDDIVSFRDSGNGRDRFHTPTHDSFGFNTRLSGPTPDFDPLRNDLTYPDLYHLQKPEFFRPSRTTAPNSMTPLSSVSSVFSTTTPFVAFPSLSPPDEESSSCSQSLSLSAASAASDSPVEFSTESLLSSSPEKKEKQGLFSRFSLYQLIVAKTSNQDADVIEKAEQNVEHVRKFLTDLGFGDRCSIGCDQIDFEALEREEIEIRGVYGTKVGLLSYLSRFNSEFAKCLGENGEIENVEELDMGVYLWMYDLRRRKGVMFVYPGKNSWLDPEMKTSMLTTFVRYLYDSITSSVELAIDENTMKEFDPTDFVEIDPAMSQFGLKSTKKTTTEDRFDLTDEMTLRFDESGLSGLFEDVSEPLDIPEVLTPDLLKSRVFREKNRITMMSGSKCSFLKRRFVEECREVPHVEKLSKARISTFFRSNVIDVTPLLEKRQLFVLSRHFPKNSEPFRLSQKCVEEQRTERELFNETESTRVDNLRRANYRIMEWNCLKLRVFLMMHLLDDDTFFCLLRCVLCGALSTKPMNWCCWEHRFCDNCVSCEASGRFECPFCSGQAHEAPLSEVDSEAKEEYLSCLNRLYGTNLVQCRKEITEALSENAETVAVFDFLTFLCPGLVTNLPHFRDVWEKNGIDGFISSFGWWTRFWSGINRKWLREQLAGFQAQRKVDRETGMRAFRQAAIEKQVQEQWNIGMPVLERKAGAEHQVREAELQEKLDRLRLECEPTLLDVFQKMKEYSEKRILAGQGRKKKKKKRRFVAKNCRLLKVRQGLMELSLTETHQMTQTAEFSLYEYSPKRSPGSVTSVDLFLNRTSCWQENSTVHILFSCRLKSGEILKIVTGSGRSGLASQFWLRPPGTRAKWMMLKEFAFVPSCITFDESLGIFLVYRIRDHSIGVFRLDTDQRSLRQASVRCDLASVWDAETDVPLIHNFVIIPKRWEAVLLRTNGEFALLDLHSGSINNSLVPSPLDIADARHLRLFACSDPMLVVVFFSLSRESWIIQGRRIIPHGRERPAFRIINEVEVPDLSRMTLFTLFSLPMSGGSGNDFGRRFLLGFDSKDGHVFSKFLSIESYSSCVQHAVFLKSVLRRQTPLMNSMLNYFFFVFSKFPATCALIPTVATRKKCDVLLDCSLLTESDEWERLSSLVLDYMSELDARLLGKGRRIDRLKLRRSVSLMKAFPRSSLPRLNLKDWMIKFITIVPMQIARYCSGDFVPLANGEVIPVESFDGNFDEQEETMSISVEDYREKLSWGMYDAILRGIDGKVYVVSCVGTQSCGKSTLLNWLGGTSFDVSAGRCTDGIWMSVCVTGDGTFVLLDFEGLGSFEKTAQQDMLCSLCGAGLSNVIVVRSSMHFGRYMKNSLSLWAKGARYLKSESSESLFRGVLVLQPIDVETINSHQVSSDFAEKLRITVGEYQETLSVNEEVATGDAVKTLGMFEATEISPMPPFGGIAYMKCLEDFVSSLLDIETPYLTGAMFSELSKLYLAQVSMGDFSSIDGVFRSSVARAVLADIDDAVFGGSVSDYIFREFSISEMKEWKSRSEALKETYGSSKSLSDPPDLHFEVTLESEPERLFCVDLARHQSEDLSFEIVSPSVDEVEEEEGEVDSVACAEDARDLCKITLRGLPDGSLLLGPVKGCSGLDTSKFWKWVIGLHQEWFLARVLSRQDIHHRFWFRVFVGYLSALVARRRERILRWSHNRLDTFSAREADETFRAVHDKLESLERNLSLCGLRHSCSKCLFPCLLPELHDGAHDCGFDHLCCLLCDYCEGKESRCTLQAGHGGKHRCEDNHECGEVCFLQERLGCAQVCRKSCGHEGEHMCEIPELRHLCGEECSLGGCTRRCIQVYSVPHDRHECHQQNCPKQCELCERGCQSQNHFHAADLPDEFHLCGREHPCECDCEHDGICSVETRLIFKKKGIVTTIDGTEVEFDKFGKQNGTKKLCVCRIPPNEISHPGAHTCILPGASDEEYHFCTFKCRMCGYFCHDRFGHSGLHDTKHGNARNIVLELGTEQQFATVDGIGEFDDGTSGEFLTCPMSCLRSGQGHVHLVPCSHSSTRECDDHNVHPKFVRHYTAGNSATSDEMKCDFFWKHVLQFRSPFTVVERKPFSMCGRLCGDEEAHAEESGEEEEGEDDIKKPSRYCQLDLWHPPLPSSASRPPGHQTGYVSDDGHFFPCTHPTGTLSDSFHTYFVIDRSGSMSDADMTPATVDWIRNAPGLRNRLGAVIESIVGYVVGRGKANSHDLVTMITFNTQAALLFEAAPMRVDVIKQNCLGVTPSGGTNFLSGLTEVFRIVKNRESEPQSPVVVLLSDGEDLGDRTTLLRRLRRMVLRNQRAVVHTILFQARQTSSGFMQEIAQIGRGTPSYPTHQEALRGVFRSISHDPRFRLNEGKKI